MAVHDALRDIDFTKFYYFGKAHLLHIYYTSRYKKGMKINYISRFESQEGHTDNLKIVINFYYSQSDTEK